MTLILPFFLGFIVALIGVFPPGLLNMTVAKISSKDGRTNALLFTFGTLIIVFLQTLLALVFARYIVKHNEIIVLLREIGLVAFTGLTVYFFWIAKAKKKKEKIKIKSKRSRFFLGILLSSINFLPIPYYAFSSITLATFGYFHFHLVSIYAFVIGVVFGTFLILYSYIIFFKKIESKTDFFSKNTNQIIGFVTASLAIITLYHILKYYTF